MRLLTRRLLRLHLLCVLYDHYLFGVRYFGGCVEVLLFVIQIIRRPLILLNRTSLGLHNNTPYWPLFGFEILHACATWIWRIEACLVGIIELLGWHHHLLLRRLLTIFALNLHAVCFFVAWIWSRIKNHIRINRCTSSILPCIQNLLLSLILIYRWCCHCFQWNSLWRQFYFFMLHLQFNWCISSAELDELITNKLVLLRILSLMMNLNHVRICSLLWFPWHLNFKYSLTT